MNIFELSNGSSDNKHYAWASGYGPIDEMPFLKEEYLKRRLEYWRVNPEAPGLHIDPGAREWPDLLGCGHSPPMFFVSERVLSTLSRMGATIQQATEMPIHEVSAQELKNKPAPRYFVVETLPGIEVDFAASRIPVDAFGKPILKPLPKPWPPLIKVRGSSWNGSILFGYSNFGQGPKLTLLCSQVVKEAAEREAWTNVRFKPIGVV